MKKQSVIVAIATWMMLILMCIHLSCAYYMEVGTTAKPKKYSASLKSLRNGLKDPNRAFFGIPMLRAPPNPLTYITIELRSSASVSLTLGIDTRNIYVVGYAGRFNGVDRSYFLKDAPSNARTSLFANSNVTMLKFEGSYRELGNAANGNRTKIGLGIKKLNSLVINIFEETSKGTVKEQKQAEFLLVAVQMVAEATRFIYLETQVMNNFGRDNFTPNPYVISLQNEWGKISTGIRNAPPSTKKISPPLQLKSSNGKDLTVHNVKTIEKDIGILNYVR